MSLSVSSYIPTGNATGTRARDQLSFPFLGAPQAMTVYLKYRPMIVAPPTSAVVFHIGNAGLTNPRFDIFTAGSALTVEAVYTNASGTQVASIPAVNLVIGNLVEVRATLSATGSVQCGVTVNGGTEVLGSASAAQALPQAWGGSVVTVGGAGSSLMTFAQVFAIATVRGVQSLDTMRRYAGTHTRNG